MIYSSDGATMKLDINSTSCEDISFFTDGTMARHRQECEWIVDLLDLLLNVLLTIFCEWIRVPLTIYDRDTQCI